MSKSISDEIYRALRSGLSLSVLKGSRKHNETNSASCAVSASGKYYVGGKIESDTNLLDFSSEHVALLKAIQQQDFRIKGLVTLFDDGVSTISPLTLKVLVDFGRRVGRVPAYQVVDKSGKTIYRTENAAREISFYQPSPQKLDVFTRNTRKNWSMLAAKRDPKILLKTYARRGLALAFPTYRGASSYGAAVMTKGKKIYFAGQYSAPEKRLGIHAEMSALIAALMEGERHITHLGLISDKYTDEPCTLCGCCRQFILELSKKFAWSITIYCFARNTPAYTTHTIDKLLPSSWSSKKWQ